MIPEILKKLAAKILHTGKYLNVVRECGKEVNYPNAELIRIGSVAEEKILLHKDFVEPIEKAYEWSSRRLLDLLFNEELLLKRLQSIKNYFFLDKGDFFVHFLDASESILEESSKKVPIEKIESLLEMALRTSSANVDPFKDDLTCELNSYTLIEQLFAMQNIRGALGNGAYLLNKEGAKKHFFSAPVNNLKVIETFTLDYRVKWPLTLIISRRAITKY